MSLHRADYMQVGVTAPRTMRLLPTSGHKTQKVVVGDQSGVVTCFGIKKHEPTVVFKTLPLAKISRVELVKDKIFVAANTEVHGLSKKGKTFFSISTFMSEAVTAMQVRDQHLYLAGDYVFSHYLESKDLHYYLAGDRINDLLCATVAQSQPGEVALSSPVLPVLACSDSSLRIIEGSDLLHRVELPDPPLCLGRYPGQGDQDAGLMYGTTKGSFGMLQLARTSTQTEWEVAETAGSGAVRCIEAYDISGDGTPDIIVGRDDGAVEVYSQLDGSTPELVYSTNIMAAVTSVAAGKVSSLSQDEVLVATFAGHVVGLSTEQQGLGQPAQGSSTRAAKVQEELAELERRLDVLRSESSNSDAAPLIDVPVHDTFELHHEDASYVLTIETPASLDVILLQSDVPIDLLDMENNSAVVSFSPASPENPLLATFRCQPGVTRIQIKIRSIEGQFGVLRVYITPQTRKKSAQLRTYQIKALSLHQRTNQPFDNTRPVNNLVLNGAFTFADIHSWVSFSLPGIPSRVPTAEMAKFTFESTFLGTQLQCSYRDGYALFQSDNVSTISILKDIMTKEATSRNVPIDIKYEINDESIPHTLMLVHPLLESQLLLSKKVELVDALKELKSQEGNLSCLSPEYVSILDNADNILAEFRKQPCHLQRLYGIVTDLYIDRFKFKGQNVQSKVPQLVDLLDNYSLASLIEFFT